jgi:hypothetical protein
MPLMPHQRKAIPAVGSRFARRQGKVWVSVLIYLVGFVLLLAVVSKMFLIPALRAASGSDPIGRRQIGAVAWLIMSLVLLYLVMGLILTFRIGRFFFPRPRGPRVKTQYIDAWAESAKRLDKKDGE